MRASTPMPGRTALSPIGRSAVRYELLREIGSGGMARVYLARAHGAAGFERLVAVKCCHPHLRSREFDAMLFDEARLAARVRHPNVVATLDLISDGALGIVMDFVEGETLARLQQRVHASGRTLPTDVAIRIVLDALAGLHAAHELRDDRGELLRLVHRDVSPQNVLVGRDGAARILDFGVAKAAGRHSSTGDGQVKGKLAYMAPEQLQGGDVDARADVFAAGVMTWEALVGQRLFRASSDLELMNLVLRARIVRPSHLVPGLPPTLDAVVLQALARNPALRFGTAAEFADALEAAAPRVASARGVAAFLVELCGPAAATPAPATGEAELVPLPSAELRGVLLRDEDLAVATTTNEPATLGAPARRAARSVRMATWVLAGCLTLALATVSAVELARTPQPAHGPPSMPARVAAPARPGPTAAVELASALPAVAPIAAVPTVAARASVAPSRMPSIARVEPLVVQRGSHARRAPGHAGHAVVARQRSGRARRPGATPEWEPGGV